MSLARRSVTSASWNVVANLASAAVLLLRSLMLARLLPVEVFGIYAFASATTSLTVVLPMFGMGGAFLYRTAATADEDAAAAVHLTLKLLFISGWVVLLILAALLFTSGIDQLTLIFLTVVRGLTQLTETPELILVRRVSHRRLAILQFVEACLTTAAALSIAWLSAGLAAILVTDLVSLLVSVVGLYLWRPFWRPRLAWKPEIVRHFLSFGGRNVIAVSLARMLDRVDDLWTGAYLGRTPLGFYSRAYTFATYPRQVLAAPIASVAGGTYAELQGDRLKLSQAFFRTNALLVRSGFLMAGLLALLAPEFIRLVIGDKWLPMLDTFRLMLVFTLLDPLKGTVADIFIAAGEPERIVRARLVQLVVLVTGLFTLGRQLGIVGVAAAVDLMLVAGVGLLFWQARRHVDFSLRRLFGTPLLALALALTAAAGLASLPALAGVDWQTAVVKLTAFPLVYLAILLLFERRQISQMVASFRRQLPSRTSS